MILLAAAALAAEPAWPAYDAVGVAGLAAAPVGVGLAVAGGLSDNVDLAGAGIITALASPPLLATSVLLNRPHLASKPSLAPTIVSLGAWAGATTIYAIGVANPYGASSTESLAVVGLYAVSVGAGTLAQVQTWDRRPPPSRLSLAPTVNGIVISGQF